ncbi:restriction endonuclease subunit S, partial [Nostoc sp. CHAB 5834]|nr:restriction endonuclease subunit S [Nostoc sp. CHAB 5834]
QILTKNLLTAKAGDFLISKMQIVHGASALVTASFDDMKVSGSYAILVTRDPELLDITFFDCISKLPWFYNLCYICSHGVHIEKMTFDLSDFLQQTIKIPPIESQRQIAEIIKTWDDAISLQTQQVQQLYRRKKEVAFRLMTKQQRLAGFDQDWEAHSLSNYFERMTTRNAVGNTNVLTISAQQGLVSQTRYFNKSIASETVSNYYLLNRGDFAYNKSYSIGYPMGVIKPLIQYEQGIVSPLYICLRPTTDDGDFFEHYFEAGMMNQGISQIAQEGARNHGLLNVSAKDFIELDTVVPSADERRSIADVLNAADAEIRLNERKLVALRTQKRGLLQQLFTGEIQLS